MTDRRRSRSASPARAEIIATVDLDRLSDRGIRRFIAAGATCLRVNGVFIQPAALAAGFERLRGAAAGRARVILDLPGFKLRFLRLDRAIKFSRGVPFAIRRAWLNYCEAFDLLREGTLLRISDGRIELKVIRVVGDEAVCVASKTGHIYPGKGVHIDGISYRPSITALSAIDRELMIAAVAHGVDCVGLSFVHGAEDVLNVLDLCEGSRTTVVPKIESKESLKRVGEIVELAAEVIIDRGDLASEIGLDKIWRAQREIISACKRTGTRVYAATQVLNTMVRHPLPSIAEIDSFYSLIHEGIDGVQLSEETSVGRYAREAIQLARSTFDRHAEAIHLTYAVAAS